MLPYTFGPAIDVGEDVNIGKKWVPDEDILMNLFFRLGIFLLEIKANKNSFGNSLMKKFSRQISIENLKLLLARSGNQCAFPGCSHPIFDDNNLFIAQLCHIEGVSPLGQRYNPNKTDIEINSYENLLFLCYRHHKVTDNVDLYPVERLKEIKTAHELKLKESTYKYPDAVLDELIKEINLYWESIEKLHSNHIVPDLAVPINTNDDILKLSKNLGINPRS